MHSNGFHYDIFTRVHILPHTPLSSEIFFEILVAPFQKTSLKVGPLRTKTFSQICLLCPEQPSVSSVGCRK